MYDYFPPRKNLIARLLVLLFIGLAIASFVASAFIPSPYKAIGQALGLLFLVPMIQIVTRYVIMRYLYRIAPYEDGNVDLEIYAYRGGNKMQLVCRVGLEEITATAPLTEENRTPAKGMRRYNYCPDIRPEEALILSITNADGDCEIILCPDEKMTEILCAPHPVIEPTIPEDGAKEAEATVQDDTKAE